MENKEYWVFTFGVGQEYAGKAVKIAGSYGEARQKMFERYGTKWAFQYSENEWNKALNSPNRYWPMEEIMEVIE